MNKNILIGSIITICILIGVSFTSVVGYNNVESNIKNSPLFNIRSSRAIDEENQGLVCEYVGKGEEITIPIPILIKFNKRILLKKTLERIIGIDANEFNYLLIQIGDIAGRGNKYNNVNDLEKTIELFEKRLNLDVLRNKIIYGEYNYILEIIDNTKIYGINDMLTTLQLLFLILVLYIIVYIIVYLINSRIYTIEPCYTYSYVISC